MKEVPLTKGYVAVVDDEDFELVNKHKWHVLIFKDGRKYATRTIWKSGQRTSQYMHQLITGYKLTDHVDLDGLNNCRSNLRKATHSQNHANQPKRGGTSKYKGVYKRWCDRKWTAKIRVNNVSIYLGMFTLEEDAAKAYDGAAKKHFGEFAVLNFPEVVS